MKPHLPPTRPRLPKGTLARDNPSLRPRPTANTLKRPLVNFPTSPSRSGSPYKENNPPTTKSPLGFRKYSEANFTGLLRNHSNLDQNRRCSNFRGLRFGTFEPSVYQSTSSLARTFDLYNRRATEGYGSRRTPEPANLISHIQPIKESVPGKFIPEHSPTKRALVPPRFNLRRPKNSPKKVTRPLQELNTSNTSNKSINRSSINIPKLNLSDIIRPDVLEYRVVPPIDKSKPVEVLADLHEDPQDSRLHKFTFQGSIETEKSSCTSSSEIEGIITSRFQMPSGDENLKLGSFCETNLMVAQENTRIDVRGSRDKIFLTKLRHI